MADELRNPILDRMVALLDGASGLFDDAPFGRVYLAPGALPAWDDCCDGQLWVRLIRIDPINGRAPTAGPCGILHWRATVGIGALRCAATVSSRGIAPSPDRITEDTMIQMRDLNRISQFLTCSGLVDGVTGYIPAGPDGGCVGGEWTATFRAPVCGCP